MSGDYEEIQPADNAPTELAVTGKIREQIKDHRRQQDLEAESHVRRLISLADDALSGEAEVLPERVLMELHYALRLDERLPQVLSPQSSELEQTHKIRFFKHARTRAQEEHPPVMQEYVTAVAVAKALGYMDSYQDPTRYAPVRLSPIRSSEVDSLEEVRPFARRRIGSGDSVETEKRAVNIDHSSCEHFLVIALPRKGKDSTACRIIGNLTEQHNYKAFSLYDDGRHETNMWGIPADEPQMQQILEKDFGQSPKAYPSKVFVPATGNLPDELPANFEPFTIGLDDLTPELVMRLASVSAGNADTERRLGIAIRDTVEQEGTIDALIQRIHDYAEEAEAQISVTELLDDEEREERGASTETVSYTMEKDKYLQEIAKSLTMLAGDGLIGDVGAETNLDLVNEFKHPDRVAVLNCNYLEPHNQYLKYVLINVWLSMIFELRDRDDLRIPRAVVELRELKNLAPSTLTRARYNKIIKSLSQTIYKIATQGGSRRMMMVGSTQKLNDVLKAVRQMMPNKIILQVGEEEVQTLDNSLKFDYSEEEQLKNFRPGWGMVVYDGSKQYPVQLCPARNGLGLGDLNWKDRYGRAMGARVPALGDALPEEADCWIDMQGQLRDPEEIEPGSWYLLPEDLQAVGSGGVVHADAPVPEEYVQEALEQRREYPLPVELHLEESDYADTQREITLTKAEDAEHQEWQKIQEEYEIPPVLSSWRDVTKQKRERMLQVLREIETGDYTKQSDVGEAVGISGSAVGTYVSNNTQLGACVSGTTRGEQLELTPTGVKALKIPWKEID